MVWRIVYVLTFTRAKKGQSFSSKMELIISEKPAMKMVAFFALALLCFSLVVSSTCQTGKIEQQRKENEAISWNEGDMAIQSDSSISNNMENELGKQAGSSADQPNGHSNLNETVSNGLSIERPSNTDAAGVPGNGVAPDEATPPDGRVYLGGEAPYAYTPTYSPKQKGLPIMPLTPDD